MTPTQLTREQYYVTLKEYVESRIAAVEKGIEIANQSMQERLAGMNEFRDTLRDQASKFVTQSELESKLTAICEKIDVLEKSRDQIDAKASQSALNVNTFFSIMALLLSIIGLILAFTR